MKKGYLVVSMIAALAMALCLAACTSSSSSSSGSTSSASASSAAASSASAASESASAASSSAAVSSESASTAASSEASSSSDAAETDEVESVYGYAGDDPVEAEAFRYVVEEIGKNYEPAEISIPVVDIFHVDFTNPEDTTVFGDFWLFNYKIEGDTLQTVSGGNFPGVMHMKKDGDSYTVTSFDKVADGADSESSARELFGEEYDAYAKIHSDDVERAELRKIIVSDYVNLNGLDITKFQDYGQDPVELYRN